MDVMPEHRVSTRSGRLRNMEFIQSLQEPRESNSTENEQRTDMMGYSKISTSQQKWRENMTAVDQHGQWEESIMQSGQMTVSNNNGRSSRTTNRAIRDIVHRLTLAPGLPIERQLLQTTAYSSKFLNISSKKHHYKLNMNKTLKKKQDACERSIMCSSVEGDKSIRINCQAGVYELIKRATLMYFGEIQHRGTTADIELWQDESLNFTQAVIKVAPLHSSRVSYTISLYHTTSSLSINGQGSKQFLHEEWPMITDIICEINSVLRNTDPETLNENMKLCLSQALDILQKPKTAGTGKKKNDTKRQSQLSVQNADSRATKAVESDTAETHRRTLNRAGGTSQSAVDDESSTEQEIQPTQTQPGSIPPQQIELHVPQATLSAVNNPPMDTPLNNTSQQVHQMIEDMPDTESVQADNSSDIRYEASQCKECHNMRVNLLAMETEMQGMHRRMKQQEKALQQREKDLNSKALQYMNSKTHIATLESQIKELQEVNRLLRGTSGPHPPPHAPYTMPRSNEGRDTEERLNTIERQLQDMRIAQLEAKVESMSQQKQQHEQTPTPQRQHPQNWIPSQHQPVHHPTHLGPTAGIPVPHPGIMPHFMYYQAPHYQAPHWQAPQLFNVQSRMQHTGHHQARQQNSEMRRNPPERRNPSENRATVDITETPPNKQVPKQRNTDPTNQEYDKAKENQIPENSRGNTVVGTNTQDRNPKATAQCQNATKQSHLPRSPHRKELETLREASETTDEEDNLDCSRSSE